MSPQKSPSKQSTQEAKAMLKNDGALLPRSIILFKQGLLSSQMMINGWQVCVCRWAYEAVTMRSKAFLHIC